MTAPLSRWRRWPAVLLLALALGGCATGGAPSPAADAASTAPAPAATAPPPDPRTLGAADAPVVVIEFSDLQCPHCARFALETFPQLRERYVDTGRVRYASRDLPLPFHRFAVPAAIAARCAAGQGRYWDYREALLRRQSRLVDAPYDQLADELGLEVGRFAACRADPATAAAVEDDAGMAAANGIASTPSFVVGRIVDGRFEGEVWSGALPYQTFAERLDALLSAQ